MEMEFLPVLFGIFLLGLFEVGADDNPNVITYKIDTELESAGDGSGIRVRLALLAQMREVEINSCFRFVEDRNASNGFVNYQAGIFADRGCVPGRPSKDLGNGIVYIDIVRRACQRSSDTVFLRAVMYSLGFVDEILRPDRDQYVTFIPACVGPDTWARVSYDKKADGDIPFQAPGATPYDLTSVMQPDTVFEEGCPLYLGKDLKEIKGPRNRGLSDIDKQRLNAMCVED